MAVSGISLLTGHWTVYEPLKKYIYFITQLANYWNDPINCVEIQADKGLPWGWQLWFTYISLPGQGRPSPSAMTQHFPSPPRSPFLPHPSFPFPPFYSPLPSSLPWPSFPCLLSLERGEIHLRGLGERWRLTSLPSVSLNRSQCVRNGRRRPGHRGPGARLTTTDAVVLTAGGRQTYRAISARLRCDCKPVASDPRQTARVGCKEHPSIRQYLRMFDETPLKTEGMPLSKKYYYRNKKLIRWDSERELSLRRHRTRTIKYETRA